MPVKSAYLTRCIKGGSRANGEPGWLLNFDYEPKFIEKFKHDIPKQYREWYGDSRIWWVSQLYEDVLDALFHNWYALARRQGTLF